MGNYRFRLSDMIPNAWFYKLKDMGRSRKNQQCINHPKKKKQPLTKTSLSSSSLSSSSSSTTTHPIPIPPNQSKTEQPHLFNHQRKSYYFTRELTPPPPSPPPPPPPLATHDPTFQIQNPKFSQPHFPDSPRKSSKQRLSRNRGNRASKKPQSPKLVSAGCGCSATMESVWTKPDSTSEDYPIDSTSDVDFLFPEMVSCQCRVEENSKFDDLKLTPIVTKKLSEFDSNNPIQLEEKIDNGFLSVKIVKEEDTISSSKEQRRTSSVRRLSVSSPIGGVRIRTNSPRIGSRKIQIQGQSRCRRRLSESLAVVKSSADPHRDFRESMVDMILENNIRGSKDLEDLLACYLQLNSDEYHELIIKVFKQIWFDLEDVKFKQ